MTNQRNKHSKNTNKQRDRDNTSSKIWLYGKHTCLQALKNPKRKCHKILVTQNSYSLLNNELASIAEIVSAQDIAMQLPPEAVHQGMAVLVSPLPSMDLEDIIGLDNKNNNLVILDHVTDPHNIGAIVRSSAAFNISAIVTTERCSPGETGILAKSASGAYENTPIVTVTNLARTFDILKANGYWILGLDGHAEQSIQDIDLPDKIAIVLGAEGKGMRSLTRKNCDLLIKLPINADRIESLNVSNAAAICLYEITRQS